MSKRVSSMTSYQPTITSKVVKLTPIKERALERLKKPLS